MWPDRMPLSQGASPSLAVTNATTAPDNLDTPYYLEDYLADYRVSRAAFYRWQARGVAPRFRKLPSGHLASTRRIVGECWDALPEAG